MAVEIASLYASIGASTQDFDRAMGKVDSRLGSLGGALTSFAKVGIGAAVAGVAALGSGLLASLKASSEFDKTMSGAAAVLQATGDEMSRLNDLALTLGKETSFSAAEAASAIEMLGAAGLNTTQILDGAARAAVDLASATGSDLVTASTVVTDAMGQFGLTTADLGRIINQVSGVSVASKFDINDYSLALAQAGGVAGKLGVSFEDLNAVLAATSSSFASGSDAGTSLKTFIQRLPGVSGPAIEALAKLGIVTADGANRFFDSAGNMKSMAEIADILQDSLRGLSEEAKIDLLSTAFGTDAIRTAVTLGDLGAEGLNKFADSIASVDAAAQAMIRLDNLAGDTEQLSGSIETLGIKIGQAFTPMARQGVQLVTQWINKLIDLDYTKFAAGFQSVMGFFTSPGVSKIVNNIVSGFRNLGATLFRLVGPLREVFGSLFNQLAIGDVNFGQVAADLGRALGQISDEVLRWIRADALPAITQRLSEWGGAFVNWVVGVWPALSARLVELSGDILDWAASIWPGVSAKLGELGRGILNWISSQDWGQYLAGWWLAFTGWAAGLWEAVQPNLAMLWGNLVAWVQGSNLGEMVMAGWTWFWDWAGGLWMNMSASLGDMWASLVEWVRGSSLGEIITGAWTWLVDWAGGLWGAVSPKLDEWWSALTGWTEGQSLTDIIAKSWTWLVDWAGDLWADISPEITKMWVRLVAWANTVDLWQTIVQGWTWITDWGGKLWEWLLPKMTLMWTSLYTWVRNVDLWGTISTGWTWFANWATALWATMKPGFDAMYAALIKWMDEGKPGLGTAVDEWVSILGGLPGRVKELWAADFGNIQLNTTEFVNRITAEWGRFGEALNGLLKTLFGEDGKGGTWKTAWEGAAWVIDQTTNAIFTAITRFVASMTLVVQVMDAVFEFVKGQIGIGEALGRIVRAMRDWWSGGPQDWFGQGQGQGQNAPGAPSMFPTGLLPTGPTAMVEININGSGADLPSDRAKLQDLARAIWREAELSGMRLQ